jgi:hypothetical protein
MLPNLSVGDCIVKVKSLIIRSLVNAFILTVPPIP